MKKYTSGSFTATKYAIYKEDTDTITSFPSEIIADGENASATVYGNMQQTGTPTPTTPITPSECGDLETTGEHSGQYKIPIESANTTTNIYIGEVQTTRIIQKLVLTGTSSDGTMNITSDNIIYLVPTLTLQNVGNAYCTHYNYVNMGQGPEMPINSFTTRGGADIALWFKTEYTTVANFKSYLAAQYAANTPVIVWYVLAEPTTGILNEPIRKIGNYADTVTATIPTIAAADNINVTTTLKPSAVDLTYTGWHKYDDKKRSGGSWGTVTSNAKKKKSLLGSRKTTKGKT